MPLEPATAAAPPVHARLASVGYQPAFFQQRNVGSIQEEANTAIGNKRTIRHPFLQEPLLTEGGVNNNVGDAPLGMTTTQAPIARKKDQLEASVMERGLLPEPEPEPEPELETETETETEIETKTVTETETETKTETETETDTIPSTSVSRSASPENVMPPKTDIVPWGPGHPNW